MVDAHERIDVATTDIPCAYLSTKIDELIVMVLREALAELFTLNDTILYHKYIVADINYKPILYIKL